MRDLKSKFFICSGLVTLLLFGQGCSDDKESDMPITIPSTEDTQPTLQKDGGSTTFSFNAPQAWSVSVRETTATRSASWLKVHPTSGAAGDATITITAEPNVTGEPRTAEVTIRSGSQTETVTVTQDYSNFITLEQREIVAGSEEQTVTLDITSTMEYEVLIPDSVDWITDGGNTRAVTTHSHTLTIAANSSYDPRQTEIVFRGKTDATLADTVKVYQAYKGAIVVAKNEYEVDAVGGALDFKVQTNLDLEVTVSANWIKQVQGRTRGLVEKDLFFDISPNESDSVGREATITVKGKDTGISQDILVRQTAYVPALDTVIYRTGYTWEEAHDNLPLLYYAYVERERHYTNGQIYTDRFVDNGHPMELNAVTGTRDDSPYELLKSEEIRNDSIWIATFESTVENLARFTFEYKDDFVNPGEWNEYVVSKLYSSDLSIGEEFDDDYERTTLQNGWYFQGFPHTRYGLAWRDGVPWFDMYVMSRVYDQFLVIDGKIIDFLDYVPQRDFNWSVEDVPATNEHGVGKKIMGDCTTYYLGRRFYTETNLILYEKIYDPNEIYYLDYNEIEWYDENITINGWACSEGEINISSNLRPIVKTNADWITIDIKQTGKMEKSPQTLDWYSWEIKWTLSPNYTSNSRTGYIYAQDKNGKKLYQKKLIQEGQ